MYRAKAVRQKADLSYTILEETRERFKLTQVQMAELMGLSVTQYVRLEKNRLPFLKIHALAVQTVIRDLDNAQRAFTGRPPV